MFVLRPLFLRSLFLRSVVALGIALAAVGVHAETLYVAPERQRSLVGSGRRAPIATRSDGPLASLDGAREALRRLRAGGRGQGPIHVVVAGRRLLADDPLVLTPEDGGTPGAPVVYEAAPNAHPVFRAGRRLFGFRRGADGLWTAHLPDVAAGKGYFEQLWVNGRRAARARHAGAVVSVHARQSGVWH